MNRCEIAAGYLQALGLQRQAPTLEFLSEMTARHVAQFAFCSVGPRLGEALPLDPESLYSRIVLRGRGGYCFEQNGLMFEVLAELGFDVTLYLARVIYDQDTHPGLTHRITVVDLAGERHLVDVGFGPLGPRVPVRLSGEVSRDNQRAFRLLQRRAGELHVQTWKSGDWFSLYRFELARYGQADCELGHFYSHRHPDAAFVRNLVASRILPDAVRSLRNREYWIMTSDGDHRQDVRDPAHLRKLLGDEFGIQVTAAECDNLFMVRT
jgi:N-hydroxyarylamine O-acetyltransferase